MKVYTGNGCIDPPLLTSALVECEWPTSQLGRFIPGERAHLTAWIGVSVGSSSGLAGVERRQFMTLPEVELRYLGRSVRSQFAYRLRYHGS
jgi:hypothetical protein